MLSFFASCIYELSVSRILKIFIGMYLWWDYFSAVMAWVVNFYMTLFRSSHRRCSIRKGVPGKFAKFTGKHVPGHVSRVFFLKSCRMKPATLFKKETVAQVFSCEFCKISKNTFFTKHLWANASDYLKNKQKLSGSEAELFARCTLPVTFCSLLVTFARCSLLFAPCSLLFACYSLLFPNFYGQLPDY